MLSTWVSTLSYVVSSIANNLISAQCQYLHRLPRPQNILHDLSRDVFGREKHASYRDDMSGVGSFSRQNTTLYIGRMAEYGEGRGENQLIKHFGEFGEIEKGMLTMFN